MDAETEARMRAKAREAMFCASLGGAYVWCTDEGERRTDWEGLHPVMNRFAEDRPPVFDYSRLDALTVARSGYLGEYAKAHANSKDVKKQKEVADFLAGPDYARRAGVSVTVDVSASQLGKAEFYARRAEGVEHLLRHGMFTTLRDAELEWMMREAEWQTGFLRDEQNPSRRRKVKRVYRNLCNRDRGKAATQPLPA